MPRRIEFELLTNDGDTHRLVAEINQITLTINGGNTYRLSQDDLRQLYQVYHQVLLMDDTIGRL